MTIDSHVVQGVAVITPKGKITIGVGDVALRNKVHELWEQGERKILANLGGVTTIDSSGIGELVGCYTYMTNRDGRFRLCNLPAKISDILQITQLITVFEVFDSEEEGVDSFQ